MNIDYIRNVVEITVGIVTLLSFLYGGFKIIKIIYQKYQEYKRNKKIREDNLDKTINIINEEILPVIQSLSREFSKNSGKSIMDRITRIDDSVRLSDLRSKLVSSNLLSTGMVEFSLDGKLTWANRAFCNLTGEDISDLLGNYWLKSIIEEDRERVFDLWTNSITHDIPFESSFSIKNTKTDTLNLVKCTILAHRDASSRILGYYGTLVAEK